MIEVITMHKKDVLNVGQAPLNVMEELPYTNSDFNVCSVSEPLSGKRGTTVSYAASTGSGYGLPRIAPSGYFANCPATVRPHSMASRITGLHESRRSRLITLRSGM